MTITFRIGIICYLCLLASAAQGQDIDSLFRAGICTQRGFALANIEGIPRPKGVIYNRQYTGSYDLKSLNEGSGVTDINEVQNLKTTQLSVAFPIVLKESFTLLGGLKRYQDEYKFSDYDRIDNFFHKGLEDKHIRSLGFSLYAVKARMGNQYFAFRTSFKLNGDFNNGTSVNHRKTSASVLYAWKLSRFKTSGFGISYSNTFGLLRVYPVLYFKQRYSSPWAIDLTLPVHANLYYLPKNGKNVFLFENRLEGDNYNLNFSTYPQTPLYLEKSNFVSRIIYEREIYDFLWFDVSIGYQFKINLNLASSDHYFSRTINLNKPNDILITSSVPPLPIIKFGVFIVPPRRWLD